MKERRRAPAQFRSNRAAIVAFALGLAAVLAACALIYRFLTLDYASRLPEDVAQREVVPEEGYVAITREPVAIVRESATPRPIATATPAPTKVPYEKYATRAQKLVMSDAIFDTAEAEITSLRVSQADGGRVVTVAGWGFITGYDAEKSRIYLAVSPYYASTFRFYNVTPRPDVSAEYGSGTGGNLQWAGFEAALCVDTFSDGKYNLGVYIVNRADKGETVEAYKSLAEDASFEVKGGKIVEVG